MRVALVNTNRIRPPIAPIGLDYVAEALDAAGHKVAVLDLCWEGDSEAAIRRFFSAAEFGLVGLTLRNTDDCGFMSRQSFIPDFCRTVEVIRKSSGAPVIAGGVGFSTMPEVILERSGADFGVWGEGEFTLPALASCLAAKQPWEALPGLVWQDKGVWRRNAGSEHPLSGLPAMSRRWVDNPRYFREGGQGGFETKRGCPAQCVYCADPVAKGRRIRARRPRAVADEIENLLQQGIDHLHTCDGEFNIAYWHALEVCRELCRRGLGGKLHWYAYCTPAPFSRELARTMRDAGCAGINFSADNGDEEMLRRLKRGFTPDDILHAAQYAREAGMKVMLDLLLGSPGESRESLASTIALMKQACPDKVGVSAGVRVYPGTELAHREERCLAGKDLSEPVYFMEPRVAPFVFGYLDQLIGGDERFLFHDPTKPERNYNYNANQRLVEAIAAGARGAYWNI